MAPASNINRRRHKRLRIDSSVRIPVQLSPIIPFIGKSIHARLVNLSAGGMAISIPEEDFIEKINRGSKITVHFRLPGMPIIHSTAIISRLYITGKSERYIGLKFLNPPSGLAQKIYEMSRDTDRCDNQIKEARNPRCDISCAFHSICRKPLRSLDEETDPVMNQFEISLQGVDAA